MSALSAVSARLVSQVAAISTGASGNIFYEVPKEGQSRPYVVLMQDSVDPKDTKNAASELDSIQVRVLYFGDNMEADANGARTIADLGRTALDAFDGTSDSERVFISFVGELTDSFKHGNKRAYVVEQTFEVEMTR